MALKSFVLPRNLNPAPTSQVPPAVPLTTAAKAPTPPTATDAHETQHIGSPRPRHPRRPRVHPSRRQCLRTLVRQPTVAQGARPLRTGTQRDGCDDRRADTEPDMRIETRPRPPLTDSWARASASTPRRLRPGGRINTTRRRRIQEPPMQLLHLQAASRLQFRVFAPQ